MLGGIKRGKEFTEIKGTYNEQKKELSVGDRKISNVLKGFWGGLRWFFGQSVYVKICVGGKKVTLYVPKESAVSLAEGDVEAKKILSTEKKIGKAFHCALRSLAKEKGWEIGKREWLKNGYRNFLDFFSKRANRIIFVLEDNEFRVCKSSDGKKILINPCPSGLNEKYWQTIPDSESSISLTEQGNVVIGEKWDRTKRRDVALAAVDCFEKTLAQCIGFPERSVDLFLKADFLGRVSYEIRELDWESDDWVSDPRKKRREA